MQYLVVSVEYYTKKVDFEIRKRERPDYYGLLDISSLSSPSEIKIAYKKKALVYHPDRHSDGKGGFS